LTELVLTILNEKAYSQGWQVFAGLSKKPVFSMEKNRPGKNSFANICQVKKIDFWQAINLKVTEKMLKWETLCEKSCENWSFIKFITKAGLVAGLLTLLWKSSAATATRYRHAKVAPLPLPLLTTS
jgi:hypothetical protein